MPVAGDKAPGFNLPSTRGDLNLKALLAVGKVVLAFYTEDNTPACDQELATFRDEYETLRELGAQVVAVSSDSVDSHLQLEKRLGGLPFPLASDVGLEVATLYGVQDEQGKRCHRAVYVIDTTGTILHAVPWFQPGNPGQILGIFGALGLQ